MDILEPKFRCVTSKAIDSVVAKFNLPHEDWMQDYPYEISDSNKIDDYFKFYDAVTDDDEKFLLMELLIQATEEQEDSLSFYNYCREVEKRLEANFKIHEYTVFYWCSFDSPQLIESWRVAPYLRELWHKQTQQEPINYINPYELADKITKKLIEYKIVEELKKSELNNIIFSLINDDC